MNFTNPRRPLATPEGAKLPYDIGQVAEAVVKGLRFLLRFQCADGAWRDFNCQPGRAEAWTTAYVASRVGAAVRTSGLAQLSAEASRSVERAATYLIGISGKDGGWGYNCRCDADCDTTSQVVLLFQDLRRPVLPRNYARIASFQLPDGAFATYQDVSRYGEWASGHPDVTAVALRALRALLRPDHIIMQRGLASLRRHMTTPDAAMAYWWRSHYYLRRELLSLDELMLEARHMEEPYSAIGPPEGCFDEALALDAEILCGRGIDRVSRASLYGESLMREQMTDGSWPTMPILGIPSRQAMPDAQAGPRVSTYVADDRRLFTTAAVVRALAVWLADLRSTKTMSAMHPIRGLPDPTASRAS